MKLSARDALTAFANPDPKKTGVLVYGANPMRVALKRQHISERSHRNERVRGRCGSLVFRVQNYDVILWL